MNLKSCSKTRRGSPILGLVLALSILLSACGSKTEPLPEAWAPINPASHYVQVFDAIWSTIEESYVYNDLEDLNWQEIRGEYRAKAENADSSEEFEAAVQEMLALLPENTFTWVTRQQRIDEEINPSPQEGFVGIGAFVSYAADPEPHLVVLSILPGSPAYLAGMRDHDSIYAIDGEAITAEEGLHALDRIRGPEGTQVVLTVDTPEGPLGDVKVTRASVDLLNSRRFLMAFVPGTNILYVRFPRLGYPQLGTEFAQGVRSFADQLPIGSMILDLRLASTGPGWPLDDMLGLFTDGEIGSYFTADQDFPIEIEGADIYTQDLPLMLLVGPDTSGLPEMFAAALQAKGRAHLVGLPTSGEVEAFQNLVIPDGSYVILATESFKDSLGQLVGINGIQPDTLVDAYWDGFTSQNDPVIFAAYSLLADGQ